MEAQIEAIDEWPADDGRDHQQRRRDGEIGKTRNTRPLRTEQLRQGAANGLSGHAICFVERPSGGHGSPAVSLDFHTATGTAS